MAVKDLELWVGAMQIFQLWLQSFIQRLTTLLLTYLPRLVLAGAILILGFGIAIVAQKVVHRLLRHALPEVQLFVGRLTYVGAVIGAILWALAVLNVHVAALATLMGTIGLAISLSSQEDLFPSRAVPAERASLGEARGKK